MRDSFYYKYIPYLMTFVFIIASSDFTDVILGDTSIQNICQLVVAFLLLLYGRWQGVPIAWLTFLFPARSPFTDGDNNQSAA